MENRLVNDETFQLVKKFYEANGHLRHQLEAYNCFIHHTIRNILDSYRHNIFQHPKTGKKYILELENYIIDSPKYPPTHCLLLNTSYASSIYIDVRITPPSGDANFRPKTFIGHLPVMVMSDLCKLSVIKNDKVAMAACNECIYDNGGYFVVKVVSKDKSSRGGIAHRMIVTPQERATPNRICVFRNRKVNPQFPLYTEVRSTSSNGYQSTFMAGVLNDIVTCVLPRIPIKFPLGIVFGAFGITDFKDIQSHIYCSSTFIDDITLILQRSLEYSYEFSTQDMCLEYIGKHYREAEKKRRFKKRTGGSGNEDDDDVAEDPVEHDEMDITLAEIEIKAASSKKSKEEAERQTSITVASEYLKREVFSHINGGIDGENNAIENVMKLKAKFLGMTINELFLVLQSDIDEKNGVTIRPKIPSTDRDHLAFKRIMDVNVLFEQQFRGAMIKMIQEVKAIAMKALDQDIGADIYSAIKPSIITNAMIGAVSCSNTWFRGTAKGVSQILDQFNYMGGEANKRKTKIPTAAEGTKMTAPHDLHASQYGVVCPSETPDGGDTGLTKNLALLALITLGESSGVNYGIQQFLADSGFFIRPQRLIGESERWVLLNGDMIGIATQPEQLVVAFREARRRGNISREVGICLSVNRNTVRINTDYGRLIYPTMVVDQHSGELRMNATIIEQIATHKPNENGEEWTWERLCSSGYIEFIDKDEEDNVLLASYPSDVYNAADEIMKQLISATGQQPQSPIDISKLGKIPTHCEIHPSMMYGIGASLIPFSDHNQSPRNCYQSNMGKQFVGVPFSNYRNMMSGKFHFMEYFQRPLTLSRGGCMVGYNDLPTGQNSKIVIMPGEYNEEDSIMMEKSAIENGFMTSAVCINHFIECHNQEKFLKPVNPDTTKGNYDKLGDNGVVKKGMKLTNGDVIVCKVLSDFQNSIQHELFVTVYKDTWDATVDKVIFGKTSEGFDYVRVMLIQRREPMIGDKFAARHSQKGTIGMIVPREDMPFSVTDGTTPNIVVNALAFPSRMTIAMLIEQMTGRAVVTKDKNSPINIATMEDLNEVLDGKAIQLQNKIVYDEMFYGAKGTLSRPGSEVDATAFRSFSLEVLAIELKRLGIPNLCSDRMMNGITGKMMNAIVFSGPVYYGRMKHMVGDKMHARQRGGKTSITRQPLEGRRIGGGMRNGVQERDNFLGVGAPNVAKDRLFKQSDDYSMWVCDICGLQANVKFVNGQMFGKKCDVCSSNQVSKIDIPFGTKLVMQELAGMGIFSRIMTSPL
jgi:DNA-directed RNA polymerase II subunit RPB2